MRIFAIPLFLALAGCTGGGTTIEIKYAAVQPVIPGYTTGFLIVDSIDAKRISRTSNKLLYKTCADDSCAVYVDGTVDRPDPPFTEKTRLNFEIQGSYNTRTREPEPFFDFQTIKCIKIVALPGDFNSESQSDWYCNIKNELPKP
jgi:hypothetical protein